jgi:hypothetical protein
MLSDTRFMLGHIKPTMNGVCRSTIKMRKAAMQSPITEVYYLSLHAYNIGFVGGFYG